MSEPVFPASYFERLLRTGEGMQHAIEALLAQYRVQPVGTGYIDLILPCPPAVALIQAVADLGVAIERMTWWCHATEESRTVLGCPHGGGGPRAHASTGIFSECYGYPDFLPTTPDSGWSMVPEQVAAVCSLQAETYLTTRLAHEPFYSSCLHVGLWLAVPEQWNRLSYDVMHEAYRPYTPPEPIL